MSPNLLFGHTKPLLGKNETIFVGFKITPYFKITFHSIGENNNFLLHYKNHFFHTHTHWQLSNRLLDYFKSLLVFCLFVKLPQRWHLQDVRNAYELCTVIFLSLYFLFLSCVVKTQLNRWTDLVSGWWIPISHFIFIFVTSLFKSFCNFFEGWTLWDQYMFSKNVYMLCKIIDHKYVVQRHQYVIEVIMTLICYLTSIEINSCPEKNSRMSFQIIYHKYVV